MKKSGKVFAGLVTVALLAALVISGYKLSVSLRGERFVGYRPTPVPDNESVLSAPAEDEADTVSDTLRPLVWFDGKVDCYELFDWYYFEDVNATGLSFIIVDDSFSASQQIFQAYVDQLSEESCLQEISRQQFENDFGNYDHEVCYTYTGSKSVGRVTSSYTRTRCNLTVELALMKTGGGVIDVAWGDGFPMDTDPYDSSIERTYYRDAPIDVDDSGPSEAPEPVSAPASGDGILPDAHAFFNGELIHTEESITNGTKVVFCVKQQYAAAAYEYVNLLQSGRFGLTLTQAWNKDLGGGKTSYYLFDCGSVGQDQQIEDYVDGAYRHGDVILQINDWPMQGWCEMSIRFSDGLTVADTGDRCTVTGIVDDTEHGVSGPIGGGYSSGSSGSGIDWDDDDDDRGTSLRISCPKCHGDGKVECSQCNGDKGKWVYDSVPNYSGHSDTTARTWEACFKCGGTGKVRCPKCDGDGHIYT